MPQDSICYHVGIIGPSDTAEEVAIARAALGELNSDLSRRGITFACHHWTNLPPGIGNPQGYIDEGLSWADIDFVIGFMRHKFGTPILDAKSGTEHEVKLILELHAKQSAPDLLFYFHKTAAEASAEVACFASTLHAKALTSNYDDYSTLRHSIITDIRRKLDAISVAGGDKTPRTIGYLPPNRRITVEWMISAQMKEDETPIPSIICFKNGAGEEFIYDCRAVLSNTQEFANWIAGSMGFAAKKNDALFNYLRNTSLDNLSKGMPCVQLWLGTVMLYTNRKKPNMEMNVAIGHLEKDVKNIAVLKDAIQHGLLPLPAKRIFINEKGVKQYDA